MKLIRYKDNQDDEYLFFWVSSKEQVLSPYFTSQQEAEIWLAKKKEDMKRQLKGIGIPVGLKP